MSAIELKEWHMAATQTVNSLREMLKQKRLQLLNIDGSFPLFLLLFFRILCNIWRSNCSKFLTIAGYARLQGKTPVSFGPTDLVCCRIPHGHIGKVYLLDRTPEKNRIVSASQDGRLIVWNSLTSQKIHVIKLPCAWVMTCAFSPSGQSVASGGFHNVCSIFNLNSQIGKDGNNPVSIMLSGYKGYVSACQYVPDEDTHLITSSGDPMCVLWDIITGLRTSVFRVLCQEEAFFDTLRILDSDRDDDYSSENGGSTHSI